MRPLYKELSSKDLKYTGNANAGLWYDKFCDQWRSVKTKGNLWKAKTILTLSTDCSKPEDEPSKVESPKEAWMRTVTSRGPVGDRAQLAEVTQRLRQMTAAFGGLAIELTTESPFVTGLGRSHPVENGFAWHHTLGVPYLAGSSIKGLVRSWVISEAHEPNEKVNQWFGTKSKVGSICFLDAVPLEPVKLGIDIMTPHYAGWNETNPPGDWMSPTPIPFLVVKPGAKFLFCMISNNGSISPSESRELESHLREALRWFGAGAKTALGYGRFGENAASTPTVTEKPKPEPNLKVGEIIDAVLLEEKTKKGGWKAIDPISGKVGHIENTADVPPNKKPGDTVRLQIRSVHAGGALTFRWPTT